MHPSGSERPPTRPEHRRHRRCVVAQPAGRLHPPRAAADRAGRAAHRRRAHRAARGGERQPDAGSPPARSRSASRGNDTFDHAKSGDCLNWPERTPGRRADRRLQGRAPLRGRRVGRHADLPRQRVRPRRRAAVAVAHSADQPGAVPGRGAPATSATEVRPEQPVHRQPAVVGRQGVAAVRRAAHAVRSAAARRQQLISSHSRARSPTSTSRRCGRQEPVWASTRRPTSRPTSRSTARRPHAMEVTGAVNLAEKFPGGLPPDAEQDAFVKDACTRMTDAYLAPDPAAQHHADADLQHDLAAELGGGQPPGVVQHRRHPRQRRLVHPAQQRQGPAA